MQELLIMQSVVSGRPDNVIMISSGSRANEYICLHFDL